MTQNRGEMSLEMTKLGTEPWQLQVYSEGIALVEGKKYRVVLNALSKTNTTVELRAGQSGGKFAPVGLIERITLSPESKRYEYTFTLQGQGSEKTRIGLSLGLGLGQVVVRSLELFPL